MEPRRVLVIGEHAPGGLRDSIVRAFRALSWEAVTVEGDQWRSQLLESAAYRLPTVASGFRAKLRNAVTRSVAGQRWDLVLVVKGTFMDRHTIDHLREATSAPVVCWNPDSPFDTAISNRGGGIPTAIRAYDAYVTWSEDVAELVEPHNRNVLVVPFAWDPQLQTPTAGHHLTEDRIVFVGTATAQRVALLDSIAFLRPVVYGNGWPTTGTIEIYPPVVGDDMSAVVGGARWNLNILRPQNARSHNMRTFELPGSGGNQVTSATDDHRRFLGNDPRTVVYSSIPELVSILKSDPADLQDRPPDLLHGHTYVDRVRGLVRGLGFGET
jgi:hypothetical protein